MPSLDTAFKYGETIFKGKVLSKKLLIIKDSNYSVKGHKIFKYLIAIKEKYKGAFYHDSVIIYSDESEASCGFAFEKDKSYIIYSFSKFYALDLIKE